jgi:hypothetical protein
MKKILLLSICVALSLFLVSCTDIMPKTEVVCESISLSKTSLNLNVGASAVLTVTFTPGNTTNKDLNWQSSDTKIVTVEDGVVKAIGLGSATVVAASSNGKTAMCTVTVIDRVEHIAGAAVKENRKAPTCTVPGSYDEVVYCVTCGAEMERNTVTTKTSSHIYGEWYLTTRDCEEGDLIQRDCTVCDYTLSLTGDPREHNFVNGSCTFCAASEKSDSGDAENSEDNTAPDLGDGTAEDPSGESSSSTQDGDGEATE